MRQVARTLIVTALTLVYVPLASQENAMAGATPRSEAATVRPGDALAIEFADGTVAAEATGGDSPRSAPRKPARKPEPGGQGSLF